MAAADGSGDGDRARRVPHRVAGIRKRGNAPVTLELAFQLQAAHLVRRRRIAHIDHPEPAVGDPETVGGGVSIE